MENILFESDEKQSGSLDHERKCDHYIEKDIFVLSLKKFEGPIDVLLDLAKRQKVDLNDISILELVEQYLVFIENAKYLNLELASEYLVMAAWLAYLKSRILIPLDEEEELSGEELSDILAFQLKRLDSMKVMASKLMNLDLLNEKRFVRGMLEKEKEIITLEDNTCLNDLLLAYTSVLRKKANEEKYIPSYKKLESVESALIRLNKMIGDNKDWKQLSLFLPEHLIGEDRIYNRSILASTFTASLELVKSGKIELLQKQAFGHILIRKKINS